MVEYKENKLSKELTKTLNGTITYLVVGIILLTITLAFYAVNQYLLVGYTLAILLIQTIWLFELREKNVSVKKKIALDIMLHIATWFPLWLLFLVSINLTRNELLPLNTFTAYLTFTTLLGIICFTGFTYFIWSIKTIQKQDIISYNVFKPTVNYFYIAILAILLYALANVPRLLGVV